MAKSIYGFAQSATTGSGVTEAIRLYTRAVAQGAGESGSIDNPDIYRIAREKYLEPLSDNLQVSTKMAESVNDENRLRDKIDDVDRTTAVFKEQVDGLLRDYSKTYYQNPQNMILTTAYVYNTAVEDLTEEIENRRAAGQSIGELTTLQSSYAKKADQVTRLARQSLAGKPQNPNAYGWFVKTNPDDGSIIDMGIDIVDSTERQTGYTRTNSYYGDIPVWTNTFTDEKGKEYARIGSNKFDMDSDADTGSKILKKTSKQWGRYLKALLPGGETPGEASESIKQLNLASISFGDVLNLPQGSIARDASNNYYYWGSDGVYKSMKKDDLQNYLNFSGQKVSDIDSVAYPISRNEVNNLGSFTNEDGTSRIINSDMLGGVKTKAGQSMLPSVDQPAASSFRTAPSPAASLTEPQNKTMAEAPIQPRKTPAVRKTSQVGRESVSDTIASQGEQFGGMFSRSSPFKNVFSNRA
jgi:hypothetical protein